jgi:hypothetical protein
MSGHVRSALIFMELAYFFNQIKIFPASHSLGETGVYLIEEPYHKALLTTLIYCSLPRCGVAWHNP